MYTSENELRHIGSPKFFLRLESKIVWYRLEFSTGFQVYCDHK
jgi:hypothetical protein